MISQDSIIGEAAESSNNSVLLTGLERYSTNALLISSTVNPVMWNNSGNLTVGDKGSGNSMIISYDGSVASFSGCIGNSATASNNSVTVDLGSAFSLSTGWAEWHNSQNLTIGNGGSGNALLVKGGGKVTSLDGIIGNLSTSSNNSVTVEGFNQSGLDLVLLTDPVQLGGRTPSQWINSGSLIVGNSGNSSALSISAGAKVISGGSAWIGRNVDSINNSVSISGGSDRSGCSSLINYGDMTVGDAGSGNNITISSGGLLSSVDGLIANQATSSNNVVLVTGAREIYEQSLYLSLISNSSELRIPVRVVSSTWSNSGNLTIGNAGSGNSMVISNGGLVTDVDGVISAQSTASNNSVLVTGSNSLWSNSGSVTLGNGQITVANGGSLAASNIVIAANSASYGTLNVGTSGGYDMAGLIRAAKIAFGNGSGAINFNQSDSFTLSSDISGGGSLHQRGVGKTILTGKNTFTGPIAINAGTLEIGGAGQLGAGNYFGDIANHGVLSYASSINQMLSGVISGEGSLLKTGNSILTLTGDNLFTGGVAVAGGTLSLGTTGSLVSKSIAVTGGSTLLLGANNQLSSDANLSLGGTLNLGGGTTRAGQSFASLTLTANSTIDFANLSGVSALSFGSIVMNGFSLSIINWNGGGVISGSAGQGVFNALTTSSSLSSEDLSKVNFLSGSSAFSAAMVNGSFSPMEVVPVPEPGVVISALLLLGLMLLSFRAQMEQLLVTRSHFNK
jgi:autotransporter-associated beta strand protein/T5SS/PEP-CTERM-associated repeat protein